MLVVPEAMLRATYESERRVFNAALIAVALTVGGCKEPPPVETTDAAEPEIPVTPTSKRPKNRDAALPDPVPVAPLDLLQKLPELPASLLAGPGDSAKALRKRKDLHPSPVTDAILVARPREGAFRTVHYQLDLDRKKVRAVLASFDPAYLAEDRKAAIEEAATLRLGKPEKLRSPYYRGMLWNTLDYRIELRTEKKSGDLELLFHVRGATADAGTPAQP